jgi:membrane-associated phospholipid phosphatase
MTKKSFYISFWAIVLFAISIIVLVSVNNGAIDLAISQNLVSGLAPGERYSTNVFGRIFEIFGEQPLYIFAQLFLALTFVVLDKRRPRVWCLLGQVISGFLSIVVGFAAIHSIVRYFCNYYAPESNWISFFSPLPFVVYALSGLIISSIYYFILRKPLQRLIDYDLNTLIRIAVVAFVAVAIGQILVQFILKPVFSRVRYRAINVNSSLTFLPWYQVNSSVPTDLGVNIKDDFHSFPSGHVASASTTFVLMLIPCYYQNMRTKKVYLLCTLIPAVYTITVALARIIYGAHYFSDVFFGFLIIFAFIWIAYFVQRAVNKENPFIEAKKIK